MLRSSAAACRRRAAARDAVFYLQAPSGPSGPVSREQSRAATAGHLRGAQRLRPPAAGQPATGKQRRPAGLPQEPHMAQSRRGRSSLRALAFAVWPSRHLLSRPVRGWGRWY